MYYVVVMCLLTIGERVSTGPPRHHINGAFLLLNSTVAFHRFPLLVHGKRRSSWSRHLMTLKQPVSELRRRGFGRVNRGEGFLS